MSVVVYAARIACDLCGTESGITLSPRAAFDFENQPTPDGWIRLSGPVWLADRAGRQYRDFCPGCASLSLAGILADIDDRAAQLKMRGQG